MPHEDTSCNLQVWTADDFNHRLSPEKLAKILRAALPILGSLNLPVTVEYGAEVAALQSTGLTFISPLSNIFWVYDFEAVANQNLAITILKRSNTFADAQILLKQFLNGRKLRNREVIPL